LFLYRRSAAVVALTPAFRDNLVARGIPAGKIAVVINGVDLARYAPRARDESLAASWKVQGKLVIGYVGTHGMSHDLCNAVRAAAELRHRSDICFLFVGDGAEKAVMQRLAQELQLQNVVFVAPQPKASMPAVWSVCDLALIHLKNDAVFAEVIPSKMFEAMAMALPLVVVAPAGEASRIVDRTGCGVWVQAGDPPALAAAVSRLMDDSSERARLSHLSVGAAPQFSRKRQADDMMVVLETVAAGGGGRVAEALQPR